MLLRAIRILPCLLIGLALAALPSILGTWAWSLSAALALALITAQQQYCRHVLPRRIRDMMHARERMLGRPRRGPVLSTTSWTRYVLEQERIREVSTTGVISVA
jgi:hypothetical protein